MEFKYDVKQLLKTHSTLESEASEVVKRYTVSDMAKSSYAKALASCTTLSAERLVSTIFKAAVVSSEWNIISTIYDYILDHGHFDSSYLLEDPGVLNFCKKYDIEDVAGCIEETFGDTCTISLCEVVPRMEEIRNNYL